MSYFGQSIENEDFSTLVPIERFYPDLAPNTVSNATPESTSEPLFQGTRILYWYHPDYVSNVDLVTDVNGEAYELFLYNAWGESLHHWTSNSSNSWSSPYRFNSKELDPETGMHYYGARYHHPKLSVWMSVDPLSHETFESYQYTGNNSINVMDPDGQAWKPTSIDGTPTGYEWVPESESYDQDGNLLEGLYHQAIYFTDNRSFDEESDYNMGSSTAFVYKADGNVETFSASTLPADSDEYATVPEGVYEAKVGLHNGKYTALRMGDVGTTNFSNNKIELGEENPAYSDGRTYATGINIHKAGVNNKTGMTTSGSPISAGCSLIDRNCWSDFIGIFNSNEQRGNTVHVSISRTYSIPLNINFNSNPPSATAVQDNTAVATKRN